MLRRGGQEDGLHGGHAVRRDVTDERVSQRPAAVARIRDVVERASVHRERNGRAAGHQPDGDDDARRTFQTVGGLGAQRVADGQVALGGERRDGQDAGGRRHLGEERLEEAVRLAEPPRIRFPDGVHLRRQTCRREINERAMCAGPRTLG